MRVQSAAAIVMLCFLRNDVHSFTPPSLSTSFSQPVKDGPRTATTPFSKDEMRKKFKEVEQTLRNRHDENIWNALFVSARERKDPVPITETKGQLPDDFPAGCLLRVGPNGADKNAGFFDGDGMIHCITFPPADSGEESAFTATYIETKGRKLEQETGKKFRGTLGDVPRGWPMIQNVFKNAVTFKTLQAQKDTCNTALAEHGGRIMALMEQCPPSEIEIGKDGRIKTIECSTSLNGAIETVPVSGGALSAHGKTCAETGNRYCVSYRTDAKPYLRLDVFAPGWELKESVGIDVPTPIFLHDCALTRNYVVIFDLPLTIRTARILSDRFPVEFEPQHQARIGLVPRRGGETHWFHCDPGVVLHASNAWESDDGKVVTIQGTWSEPSPNECYLEKFVPSFLYEYSIEPQSGILKEECLNAEEAVEFPMINERYFTGKECASTYCVSVMSIGGPTHVYRQPREGIIFDGVVKFAATTTSQQTKGDVIGRYRLPDRWYGVSEPTVVPKDGKDGEYVVIIATNVPEGVNWEDVEKDLSLLKSQLMVFDGDELETGPLYVAILPYSVPYGLHSSFIDWETMK